MTQIQMTLLNDKMCFLKIIPHRNWRFLPALLMLLLISCGKDNAFDLFQSTGSVERRQRVATGYFDKISLNDNVNLVITQGNPTLIEVEGGSHLLSDITTEINDSTLTISNNNKYNWVRSYDKKITVYLQLSHLIMIRYESSGDITTSDTIHEDSLRIEAWGGSGTIAMAVECGSLSLVQHYGSMDFDFTGKNSITYIYAGSYGAFHCLGLKSDCTFIRSEGTNDCYVNAKDWITADIHSSGNTYYTGNPGLVSRTGTGSGQLIPFE